MLRSTNKFIKAAYENACKHGFHDENKSIQHWLMLVISEIGEAVDADRKKKHANICKFMAETAYGVPSYLCFGKYIKDTVEDEMADIAIRLYDFAGMLGVDFDERELSVEVQDVFDLNCRKSSFCERAFYLVQSLSGCGIDKYTSDKEFVAQSLCYLECWAKAEDVDLLWHIEKKMEYNKCRERCPGKAY